MAIPANLSFLAPGASVAGVLSPAKGGTGLSSPGTAGNVLTSNGTDWVSNPSSNGSWSIKTSNYTAVAGEWIFCDTTAGAFTITLPATPSATDYVTIASGPAAATNAVTIARNGSTIMGLAENMNVNNANISFQLVYSGTTWRLA